MIKFEFVLSNPWSSEKFTDKWNHTFNLFKHKYLELQLYKYTPDWFGVRLNTLWRSRHHAGPELELILLRYTLVIKVYDSRHWDYENRTWEKQGEIHE